MVQDVFAAVSQRLESYVSDRRTAAVADSATSLAMIDAAGRAVEGGKRLRAQFCHAGWRAVSPAARADADAVLTAGAALEIFQAAALVHDDIIDNSDTRRGRPAAHRALEHLHLERGWAGDSVAFGRSAAILLGDLLVAWSDDLFEDALAMLEQPRPARREYASMRRDVTLGQFLDVTQEAAWITQPSTEHARIALEVASMKSARYSVQQPLVIGGALGGGSAAQLDALRAFGHPVGLAFQLRDDLLGVFGDAAQTGKPAGDDLREGKRTLLIAYAREAMDADARAALDARLGDPALDAAEIAALQATITASGALERVEARIRAYVVEADAALADAPLDADALTNLRTLAHTAAHRDA